MTPAETEPAAEGGAIPAAAGFRAGRAGALARARAACTPPRLLLVLITAAAACVYAWSLNSDGLEAYYAAGVRSMSGNWHDFLYDAFDPKGSITLDKLPGAFWVQALSVRVFGYSVWAMVLPQVVESTLTVLVLYRAVRRTAGTGAALVAAAVLAASPVTIASTRGNLSEPLYLLCLVLAADAVLRGIVKRRRRSAYAAAFWIAVGFQAKMTEAWLVLPALMLAVVAGTVAGTAWWRAVLRATAVALVAVALSLTWVCAFALTPASARPVADGSTHNSIFQQVFSYNGDTRFGGGVRFGLAPLAPPTPQALRNAALAVDPTHGRDLFPPATVSRPGWDRLFVGSLAPDCAWFLPCAAVGAVVLLRVRRRAGRGDPARAAALLWTAWLLLYGAAFSDAGAIHDYYLATLVPAIAALTGLGLSALWSAARRGRRQAVVLLPLLVAAQGAWGGYLLLAAHQGRPLAGAAAVSGLAAAAGLAVVHRGAFRERAAADPGRAAGAAAVGRTRPGGGWRLGALAVAAMALAAGFTGPIAAGNWLMQRAGGPFDTPFAPMGSIAHLTAAARVAQAPAQAAGYGPTVIGATTPAIWSLITGESTAMRRALATSHTEILVFASSMASNYVMGGLTEIQPVGGYSGGVPYPTVAQVKALVRDGRISFAILPTSQTLVGNDPRVRAVEALCSPGLTARNEILYNCAQWAA